jgi:hypothetical protein
MVDEVENADSRLDIESLLHPPNTFLYLIGDTSFYKDIFPLQINQYGKALLHKKLDLQ